MSYSNLTTDYQHNYEIVKREVVYQGVFRLVKYHVRHKLFNGGWSQVYVREVLERLSAVAVLPYDPILDRVVLIEQFRPGPLPNHANPWLIEIIAGVIDSDEAPEAVAIREAEEEAGCKIESLYPLFQYFVSPGGTNEYLNIYIAKSDTCNVDGIHGLENENEDIRVINLPAEKAFEMAKKGEINTAPAILTLNWLEYNRDTLKIMWGI